MKIGHLLSKNRNRLGVLTYENTTKRRFYFSVKWQQNVSGLGDSNGDVSYTLLCIGLPFWSQSCRRTQQKNKYLVMPFIQNNVLNRQIQNLFPMAFPLKMGGAGKGIGSSSPRVHLTSRNSFPPTFNGKDLGTKLANVSSVRWCYCFFNRSFLFAIVLWSPYKLIQGNETNTKTQLLALYNLPMNIYCLRQVNQYIKWFFFHSFQWNYRNSQQTARLFLIYFIACDLI